MRFHDLNGTFLECMVLGESFNTYTLHIPDRKARVTFSVFIADLERSPALAETAEEHRRNFEQMVRERDLERTKRAKEINRSTTRVKLS